MHACISVEVVLAPKPIQDPCHCWCSTLHPSTTHKATISPLDQNTIMQSHVKEEKTLQLQIKYPVPGNASKRTNACKIGLISGYFAKKHRKGRPKTAAKCIPCDVLHCAAAWKEAAVKVKEAERAANAGAAKKANDKCKDLAINLTAVGHAAAKTIASACDDDKLAPMPQKQAASTT